MGGQLPKSPKLCLKSCFCPFSAKNHFLSPKFRKGGIADLELSAGTKRVLLSLLECSKGVEMDKIVVHHWKGLSNTILRAKNFVFVLFSVYCEQLFLYENDPNMEKV